MENVHRKQEDPEMTIQTVAVDSTSKNHGNSRTTSQKLAKLDALISAILFANHVIELRLNFKNSKVTLLCNKKLSLDLMVVRIL
jgi:hypothetical protein